MKIIGQTCSFLHTERQNYIEKLHNNPAIQNTPNLELHNAEFLTQLTLDASAVLRKEQIDKDTWGLLGTSIKRISAQNPP